MSNVNAIIIVVVKSDMHTKPNFILIYSKIKLQRKQGTLKKLDSLLFANLCQVRGRSDKRSFFATFLHAHESLVKFLKYM